MIKLFKIIAQFFPKPLKRKIWWNNIILKKNYGIHWEKIRIHTKLFLLEVYGCLKSFRHGFHLFQAVFFIEVVPSFPES